MALYAHEGSEKGAGKPVALGEFQPFITGKKGKAPRLETGETRDETQTVDEPQARRRVVQQAAGQEWHQISEVSNRRASDATRRAFNDFLPELRLLRFTR